MKPYSCCQPCISLRWLLKLLFRILKIAALTAATCPAELLQCPLPSCEVTSDFKKNRYHPVLDKYKDHWGTDYRAARDTEVRAAKGGTVSESKFNTGGLGEIVIIKHDDGSSTLYAHLLKREVEKTTPPTTVSKGQLIGLSDDTGLSDKDHLHLEYVASGDVLASPSRIDPHACMVAEPPPPPPPPPEDPFVGTWHVNEVATSTDPSCSGTDAFDLVVTKSGTTYSVTWPGFGSVTGTASSGNLNFSFEAEYEEDNGETEESGSGSITSSGSFNATSSWTYTEGAFVCTGTSTYTGSK